MKTKTTIILFIIAVLLGVYIFVIEKKLPTTDEIEAGKKKVFAVKSGDINKISIKSLNSFLISMNCVTPSGKALIFNRTSDGKWEITEPIKTRADQSMLDNIASQLAELDKKDTVKDISNLENFGVLTPMINASFQVKDKTYNIKFGKDAPLGLGVYMAVDPVGEGQKEVYVVERNLADLLGKPGYEYRNKKIVDANTYDINNLKLVYPDKTIEVQKKNDEWYIAQPISEKVDQTKVRDLLSNLSTLSVATFLVDNETDIKKYGLDKPLLKVIIPDPKEANKSETILIGEEMEKDKNVAAKEGIQTIVTINKSSIDKIMLELDDLRNRKILDLETAKLKNIRMDSNRKEVFYLEKDKDNKWQFTYPAMTVTNNAPADVDSFIDKLNNTLIEQFVADTTIDLTPYGLSEPFTGVELVFNNTASPTVTTRIQLAMGNDNKYVYVKKPDEIRVISVSPSLWDYLKQGSIHFRKKSMFNIPSEQVRKLTISAQDKTSIYEQVGIQEWKMISPTEAALGKYGDLTNLMLEFCNMSASEFVVDININPDLAAYGLEKPDFNITLEYGDKSRQSGTTTTKNLHIGKKAETHYYARLEDDMVIFKMTANPVDIINKILEGKKESPK
ncbi:MAG: DUF4340 domain-containing protein [Planctomycetota bacterium]